VLAAGFRVAFQACIFQPWRLDSVALGPEKLNRCFVLFMLIGVLGYADGWIGDSSGLHLPAVEA